MNENHGYAFLYQTDGLQTHQCTLRVRPYLPAKSSRRPYTHRLRSMSNSGAHSPPTLVRKARRSIFLDLSLLNTLHAFQSHPKPSTPVLPFDKYYLQALLVCKATSVSSNRWVAGILEIQTVSLLHYQSNLAFKTNSLDCCQH